MGPTAEVEAAGDDGVGRLGVGVEDLVVEDAAHGAVGVAGRSGGRARMEVGVEVSVQKPGGGWQAIKIALLPSPPL